MCKVFFLKLEEMSLENDFFVYWINFVKYGNLNGVGINSLVVVWF